MKRREDRKKKRSVLGKGKRETKSLIGFEEGKDAERFMCFDFILSRDDYCVRKKEQLLRNRGKCKFREIWRSANFEVSLVQLLSWLLQGRWNWIITLIRLKKLQIDGNRTVNLITKVSNYFSDNNNSREKIFSQRIIHINQNENNTSGYKEVVMSKQRSVNYK